VFGGHGGHVLLLRWAPGTPRFYHRSTVRVKGCGEEIPASQLHSPDRGAIVCRVPG
jgi:hypothetical protein